MEKKNKSRGLKEILELTLKLEDGVDVRKNLIELKSGLKELSKKDTYKLTEYFEDSEELVEKLLNNEDAKVRKNIALVLGQLSCQKYLKKLYAAYKNESQLFVRSSYLEAMQNLDVDKIVEELRSDYKKASEALKNADEADKKHYLEPTWLVYRNGNPQKQNRGMAYRYAFEEALAKISDEGGQSGIDPDTGLNVQYKKFRNIPV